MADNNFADEEMTVTLELDDGEVECAVITILTVEDKDYIVLLPLDENGENEDGEVWSTATRKTPMMPMQSPSLSILKAMRNMKRFPMLSTNI